MQQHAEQQWLKLRHVIRWSNSLFFRKLITWQLRNEWRANSRNREFPHWFTEEA